MKKLLILSAIFFGAVYSASAQYYYNNNSASVPRFGLGLSTGIATGPVSSAFPEAGGVLARFEFPVGRRDGGGGGEF